MSEGIGSVAVRGVFWTGAGQVARQVIQVVGSIALARLLAPDDFGLLGMAMFFIGIGQLFADFGIGSAIVQSRVDDRIVLSSCFWLNVAVAGALALITLAGAPLVATFYKRSDLTLLVAVLSLNLLLSGLQTVPQALLYRDMRFADLARMQVLGSLAGAIAAVGLALMGAGVWALVAQPLAGSAIALIVVVRAARWYPRLQFSWREVAPLAKFSTALLGTTLVGYANRNVDSLLVGRLLGAGPLGLYAMAIQLMLYPLQQVSSVIVRVLFPAMVHLKDDTPRLRAGYLRAVSGIALITFPMMGGLFVVADDFVAVVFGTNWTPMVPVLKVLAWVGMMQSIATTVGAIYLATGRPGLALRVSLIGAPVLIGGMASGIPWGILGVAIGYAIASFSLFYFVASQAFRLIDLRLAAFHAVVVRPLSATLLMIGSVVISAGGLSTVAAPVRLASSIVIGIATYVLASLAINRRQLNELWDTLRGMRRARITSFSRP